MSNSSVFLLLLSIFFTSSNALAANGGMLIGLGPISQGMGGVGAAIYTSPVGVLSKNPAMLDSVEAKELDISVSAFLLDISADGGQTGGGAGFKDSRESSVIVPGLAYAQKLSDKIFIGVGFSGIAGNNTDYTGQTSIVEMQGEYSVARIAPMLAFKTGSLFTLGISPFVNQGKITLNHYDPYTGSQSNNSESSVTASGFSAGAKLEFNESLRFGAFYTSESKLKFKNVIDFDIFGPTGKNGVDNLILETPAEYALGMSFSSDNSWIIAIDWTHVLWSDTLGTGEFGWKDQDILALGTQIAINDAFVIRAGLNVSKSPITSSSGEASFEPPATLNTTVDVQGHTLFQQNVSALNVLLMPAVSEDHITVGCGYEFNENLVGDFALNYSPESKVTRSGRGQAVVAPGTPPTSVASDYSYTTKVSLMTLTLGIGYAF